MKKHYMRPGIVCQELQEELLVTISDNETSTTPVHVDDSQDPGNAMSRRRGIWDDE